MGDIVLLGYVDLLIRNWALISIVLTLILLVGVPVAILRKYVRIIANIFYDSPIPLSLETRDYPRPDGEIVEFRAFDGHRLWGRMVPAGPDRPLRGTIIFAHELNSDMNSVSRYCAALTNEGFEVFAFDFRGQGRSATEAGYTPRLWPSDREQSDVLGAIAYVEDCLERRGRPRALGLVGISRGAGAALLAAVNVPSVKAIMIDGGFSTDVYLEYLMQRWVSIFAKVRLVYENHPPVFWRFLRWLSIREVSRRLNTRFPSVRKAVLRLGNVPMLIVHGERDGLIPAAQARLLYELAGGPKYLWICPGAKHNQAVAVQPAQYGRYSVGFFSRYLGGGDSLEPLADQGLLTSLTQTLAAPPRVSYAQYTKPVRMRRGGRR